MIIGVGEGKVRSCVRPESLGLAKMSRLADVPIGVGVKEIKGDGDGILVGEILAVSPAPF